MDLPIDILQKEVERRLIEEGISRIKTCLDMLEEKDVWYKANDVSNSIGHLILHLNGNVRQWLIEPFAKLAFDRKRDEEFQSDPLNKALLNQLLDALALDIHKAIKGIPEFSLDEKVDVQVYRENRLSMIIHVIEHFSYHVGQITFITKMLTNRPTGYYAHDPL